MNQSEKRHVDRKITRILCLKWCVYIRGITEEELYIVCKILNDRPALNFMLQEAGREVTFLKTEIHNKIGDVRRLID